MTLFSLVNFVGLNARDWQVRTNIYKKRPPLGVMRTVEPLSKDLECTSFSQIDLQARLRDSGNLFADADLTGISKVCLPPNSEMVVSADSLTISNPVCEMVFRVETLPGSNPLKPGAPNELPPLLSGGVHQFDTKQIGIRVKTTFFALRSQRLEIAKYKEWTSRLVAGAREWFES